MCELGEKMETNDREAETEKSSLIVSWDATSLATEVALSLPSTGFVLYVLIFLRCGDLK